MDILKGGYSFPDDEQVGCFHILSILNNAAKGISGNVFMRTLTFVCLGGTQPNMR